MAHMYEDAMMKPTLYASPKQQLKNKTQIKAKRKRGISVLGNAMSQRHHRVTLATVTS